MLKLNVSKTRDTHDYYAQRYHTRGKIEQWISSFISNTRTPWQLLNQNKTLSWFWCITGVLGPDTKHAGFS